MASDNQPRKLFILRHGERLDFTFKKWITENFDRNGQYIRTDLNMPAMVHPKQAGPIGYNRDSPLTNIGLRQAQMIGEYFRTAGIEFAQVFSSPALRCVQTAQEVLKEKNIDKKDQSNQINIENGIFEWLGWYTEIPDFFTPEELKSFGYDINTTYESFMDEVTLHQHIKEPMEVYYERGTNVTRNITDRCRSQAGDVLLVCHGGSLDALSNGLLGGATRTKEEADRYMGNVPFCSLLCIENREDGEGWKLVDAVGSRITHGYCEGFNFEILQ